MADQVQITLGANVQNAISGLASFARSAQLATAAFVAGFTAATKHAIEFADEIGKMAQKAGTTVEEFSRLAYAGKLAGLEMEGLKTGFKGLSNAIKDNGRIFDDLGISRFSNGGFRDASDVLNDIADKFQSMPDGVRKTTLAVQLFGKSGQDMIPMLNQGREGLAKMREEADALGVTISKDLSANSEVFNDNMTKIGMGVKGLFLKISEEVLPSLNKATNASVSVLKVMNRELSTYFSEVNELYRKVAGTSQLAGFSGMDKKIEAKPGDSGIEYLNREQSIRAQIAKNDLFMKQQSEAYGLSDQDKQKRELAYLDLKLHYTTQLVTELQKSPPKGSLFGADDPNGISKEAQEYNEKLIPAMEEQTRIQEKVNKLKAESTISGQTQKQFTELMNSIRTVGQSVATVFVAPIQGAFTGLQGSIAGLIKGTMTWKDAMRNVAASIVEQLVSAIAMLIAKAIILTAVITALNFIAPGLGSALGFAAGIGARAEGGVTGPGIYTVGEQGPEYVINNKTLNRYGTAYFDALQSGKTPASPASASASPTSVHIGFIGGHSMVGQWAESREGRKFFVDIADERIREARG